MLIVLNDIISDVEANENNNKSNRVRKLDISLVFISQSYFEETKDKVTT